LPADLSAAEIRAEIIAQFQAAFPEYRLLKVIPAPGERAGRRQTPRSGSGARSDNGDAIEDGHD
jgi:hypothetical protein